MNWRPAKTIGQCSCERSDLAIDINISASLGRQLHAAQKPGLEVQLPLQARDLQKKKKNTAHSARGEGYAVRIGAEQGDLLF